MPSKHPILCCPLLLQFSIFPSIRSFQMSQLFASGGQRTGVSASTSVLPMNTQDCSPLEWTGWISLKSRDSQESSPTPQLKSINSSALSFLYSPTLTSIESVMPSSHLILCHPLLLLLPTPPSIRVFCNESTLCMRWPKYWSFSFSITPPKISVDNSSTSEKLWHV